MILIGSISYFIMPMIVQYLFLRLPYVCIFLVCLHRVLFMFRRLTMDKRAEERSAATRSGALVGMQGRSPAVNVINITRRSGGGIVNVEMKRQEGMNQKGTSHPSAVTALPSHVAVPVNVYRQPAYVTEQQSGVIPKQLPRNVSAQPHSVDSRLDWSDQHRQRMPTAQPVVHRSNTLTDQHRLPPSSNHGARTVVEQHMLHSQVKDTSPLQHAHTLPASDHSFMSSSNTLPSTSIPSVHLHMEGTNGGISYWPAQMGNDLPVSSTAAGRLAVDPKSGNVAPQLISRLPGLQYDVIPPRSDGPSEAERKVAVLTQQLQDRMQLTTPQGSLLRQQTTDSFSQYRSPPPYYGPHITANMKITVPSNCVTTDGNDSDHMSKKAGDGVRQTVSTLSSGPTVAAVEQPQQPVHQGSDLDASAESYGKPVLVLPL